MARGTDRTRTHVDRDHVGRHRPAPPREGEDRADLDAEGERAPGPSGAPRTTGVLEASAVPERTEEDGGAGVDGVVPVFTVPESLRSVDVAVAARAVRGLLLVAAVVLLSLGGRWWWVQQQAAGVPVEQVAAVEEDHEDGDLPGAAPARAGPVVTQLPAPTPTAREPDASTGPHGSLGDGPAAQAAGGRTTVMVHVVGRVRQPGVVELPPGSRVVDAVQAAGGVTDEADPASLNLARPVVDGEQVWVGAPGEDPPPGLDRDPPPAAQPAPPGGAPGGPGPSPAAGGPLDLNQADQAQLEELPGVGPVTAGNILTWRQSHGRFSSVEELTEVSGIGEKTLERLRPHVTVGG